MGCGLLLLRRLCRDWGLVPGTFPTGDNVDGLLLGVAPWLGQPAFEVGCLGFGKASSSLLCFWGEWVAPRSISGYNGNMGKGGSFGLYRWVHCSRTLWLILIWNDSWLNSFESLVSPSLGVKRYCLCGSSCCDAGKSRVGMVPPHLPLLVVMMGCYIRGNRRLWRLIWQVSLGHCWFQALGSCAFLLGYHAGVSPLVGGWLFAGKALFGPLTKNKMMLQRWWAWIVVSAPSRRASMEVKLPPIEVEISCELLIMEKTPNAGDIFMAATFDRLGGWWLHLPNLEAWFLAGRTILCPLILNNLLFQQWWVWTFVPAPCMASMEVKLSPIEVEDGRKMLVTPCEGDIFMATAGDRLGGGWFHPPNFDDLIFLSLALVVEDPFTIEVGKETAVSWKIIEGAGLRKGPRWKLIFGLKKKK